VDAGLLVVDAGLLVVDAGLLVVGRGELDGILRLHDGAGDR
jgi:hypothetical protein